VPITLTIAGVDRTEWLKIDSGRISRAVNGPARFTGTLEDQGRGYTPAKGSTLVIELDDGSSPVIRLFAGHIRRVIARSYPRSSVLQFGIEAGDYNHILSDRMVTTDIQAGLSLYAIVSTIVSQFLAGENITLNHVTNPGPIISEPLRFYYETADSVFRRLATITGFFFSIDFYRDFHFGQFTSEPATFEITNTSDNWSDFEVEYSDEDYRNRQHERTEGGINRKLTESYVLDEVTDTTVPSEATIQELIYVKINGSPRTFIAVNPYDGSTIPTSGYDFYYFPGGQGVFALDYTPVVNDVEEIQYRGVFSQSVVTANDYVEQAARAILSGGSGIVEAIEEQRNVGSPAALLALAIGRLRQFGNNAARIRFKLKNATAEPGQSVSIVRPIHNLNGNFSIEGVDYDWKKGEPGTAGYFEQSVRCTSVEPFGQPSGLIERLIEMARIGPPDGEAGTGEDDANTTDYEKAVWHIRGALVAGDNATNHHEVLRDGIPFEAFASTRDGEPITDCIIQVRLIKQTGSSPAEPGDYIFVDASPSQALVIPAGEQRSNDPSYPSPTPFFEKRDFLELDVIEPGGASNVQITVKYR